jgi:hypothetical protein
MEVALIGAAGTLLGIVLTALFALTNERVKWKRDQRVRFNSDRIEAYAGFLAGVEELLHYSEHLAALQTDASSGPVRDRVIDDLNEAVTQFTVYLHKVIILGSPSVVAVAREMRGLVQTIHEQAPSVDAYRAIRDRFYEVVRNEVHVG